MKPLAPLLIAYLEQLDAPLGALPMWRRTEIWNETQEHLEAMVAARRADGLAETEVWNVAFAAFGDPEALGNDLAREWKRAPRSEVVGTPLSRNQRLMLFARPIIFTLAASAIFSWLVWKIGSQSLYQEGSFALVVGLCAALDLFRGRRTRPRVDVARLVDWEFLIASCGWFWEFIGDKAASGAYPLGFGPSSISSVLVALSILWQTMKMEREGARRQSAHFFDNPIAAEEARRLHPQISFAVAATTALVGASVMGWSAHGWFSAASLCAMQVIIVFYLTRRAWSK